jgi:hypothetical protein
VTMRTYCTSPKLSRSQQGRCESGLSCGSPQPKRQYCAELEQKLRAITRGGALQLPDTAQLPPIRPQRQTSRQQPLRWLGRQSELFSDAPSLLTPTSLWPLAKSPHCPSPVWPCCFKTRVGFNRPLPSGSDFVGGSSRQSSRRSSPSLRRCPSSPPASTLGRPTSPSRVRWLRP